MALHLTMHAWEGKMRRVRLVVRSGRHVAAGERRHRLLADAGLLLGAALDREQILNGLARLAVPALADGCIVDLMREGGGRGHELRVFHRDSQVQALLRRLWRPPFDLSVPPVTRPLLEDGVAVVRPALDERTLSELAPPPQARLLRRVRPCSLLGVPLRARGRAVGALLLLSCRSRRRFARADLPLAAALAGRAAVALLNATELERAVEAARARQRVLAVVAHDLRTPIAAVLLTARSLEAHLADPLDRRLTAIIARAARRMQRLTDDLVDLASIEAGRLALRPEPVAVAALLEEALRTLEPLAADAGVALCAEPPPSGLTVVADEDRVMEVLSNLVTNALKFTPRGGTVTLGCQRAGEVASFLVEDSGPGIPADDLSRLFEPFWQHDGADRRGLGLGLTIARGVVRGHGGRIWAESRPGQGSTFRFTLPVAEGRPNGPGPAPAP